jgi:glyoxylase-like metal-dependent hydrolase (beta-lactamase superfamily II)
MCPLRKNGGGEFGMTISARFLGSVLCVLSAALPASAQDAPPRSPYDIINSATAHSVVSAHPVRGAVQMVDGAGGNIVALLGDQGVLLVDTGIAIARDRIAKALGGLDGQRLRYVINTHWHWDHTDGNGWARQLGATILAAPNTIRHLSETIRVEEWGHTFQPVNAEDRPSEAVTSERTLRFDGENVLIRPYSPGHTDGDLWVYFEKADVLATGDTFWNGHYPFIDYVAGGSIDGTIHQAEAILAAAGKDTLIVPGHGPIAGRADLQKYRDILVDIRSRVGALKKLGKSLDEVIATKPTAAYDAVWGTAVITPELFVSLVYRGL